MKQGRERFRFPPIVRAAPAAAVAGSVVVTGASMFFFGLGTRTGAGAHVLPMPWVAIGIVTGVAGVLLFAIVALMIRFHLDLQAHAERFDELDDAISRVVDLYTSLADECRRNVAVGEEALEAAASRHDHQSDQIGKLREEVFRAMEAAATFGKHFRDKAFSQNEGEVD